MRALVLLLALLQCPPAVASDDDAPIVRVPISKEGQVDLSDAVTKLADATGCKLSAGKVALRLPIRGVSGALTRAMLSKILGSDVRLSVEADALILKLDPDALKPQARADWQARLAALAEKVRRDAQLGRAAYGMRACDSYRPNDPARPTICLVHGMNSASGCFVHMIPILEQAGYGVVVYDFPDNQDMDVSAPQFVADWRAARMSSGDREPWSILGHSMGGLLGRYYVEGDDYENDVSTLILIAPPNQGSSLAKAQGLFQLLQNVQGMQGASRGMLLELGEGLGEAADDLVPGSAFLKRLNSRPRREGIRYHILAGDTGFLTKKARADLDFRLATATQTTGFVGRIARAVTGNLPAQLDELTDGTGDGAVALASTQLEGVGDRVILHANHVELIRGPLLYPEPGPVVCMPLVLRWLPPTGER